MASTYAPAPADSGLRQALQLAAAFALLKLAIQIGVTLWTTHLGYGYFRDEMYYILCGRFLDWGYVDHTPMVALQARLAEMLFGKSLVGLRMFGALAGAAKVLLTGLLAWALGGGRRAQALAMIAVLAAPVYSAIDGFLSMNSFEPVFWMSVMLAVLLMFRGGSPRWWLFAGTMAGLGLENKPSMLFFLVALLAALALTPQRRLLWNRWFVAGLAITTALCIPNLMWQLRHNWATLEFLRAAALGGKNVQLAPLPFMGAQLLTLNPINVFVWGAGLAWLAFSRRARGLRWIPLAYVLFLAIMIPLHAKDYYIVPFYPVLFAAGGLAWEGTGSVRASVWRVTAMSALLVVTAVITYPMAEPVLRPEAWLGYTHRLHLVRQEQEKYAAGPLPQFFGDRFGWQEMVDQVAHAYESLPAEDRARCAIYTSNYGEASAINFLGEPYRLPFAISGHNNYYLWGPHGYTGDIAIVISGETPEEIGEHFRSVQIVGRMDHPYSVGFEHRNIYLCRDPKHPIFTNWSQFKHYE